MSQVSVDSLHGISFFLVMTQLIGCTIVERVIDRKSITVILFGLRGTLQASLHSFWSSPFDNFPTQNTARSPIYNRDDVDFVFLLPIKVKSSSSSATFGFWGTLALGNCSAYSLTQFATLWWFTFRRRSMPRKLLPSRYNLMAFLRTSTTYPFGLGWGV